MRRPLACDFFLAETVDPEDEALVSAGPALKVFAGPRGIVIADALVPVPAGRRVLRGEALVAREGTEFVYRSVVDVAAPACVVALRFVVKNAHYDPATAYSIRNEHVDTETA